MLTWLKIKQLFLIVFNGIKNFSNVRCSCQPLGIGIPHALPKTTHPIRPKLIGESRNVREEQDSDHRRYWVYRKIHRGSEC